MKKIFLYAYDKQNLGDDLFIKTITSRYPKAKFYLWSSKQNRDNFKTIKNLKVIDENGKLVRFLQKIRPSLVSRYKSMLKKRAKALVYIGGSIFIQYDAWKQYMEGWEYDVTNYSMYALGCNFGPYQTEEYRVAMANVFAKMKDICFRDTYSKNLFSSATTVRQAPDILLGYSMPLVAVEEKQIFVSVIDCAGRDEGDTAKLSPYGSSYIENLARLLSEYLRNGYSLTLASFCKAEGDEKAVYRLRQKMGVAENDARVKNLFYDGVNDEEVLRSLAAATYVISTRFHGVILALIARRPVLPIVYSDKTLHVLEDMGFNAAVIDLRQEETVSFEKAQENFLNFNFPNVDELKERSLGHFTVLDQII